MGSKVFKAPVKEVGWDDIDLTGEAQEDPLFSLMTFPVMRVLQWHEDTFEIPKEAVLLASSRQVLNQAYRYKSVVYGLQFHIEVNRSMLENWFENSPQKQKILTEYGEEKFAGEIAREIINSRQEGQIKNTSQLVTIIRRALPARYQRQKIHPATRTFQALRIAVNDELNNLQVVLPQTLEVLKKGGRLVVISFHSLEDRIVKNFLKDKVKENLISILAKKPVVASFQEIKDNPRARSAKLRAAVKV